MPSVFNKQLELLVGTEHAVSCHVEAASSSMWSRVAAHWAH